MRRKTISRELFTSIALVLLLSLALMCGIQSALSIAYFSGERMSALTSVLDGATALSNRFAAMGRHLWPPDGQGGDGIPDRAHVHDHGPVRHVEL